MKNLFERLFKKQAELHYIIPEYQPIKFNRMQSPFNLNEFDASNGNESDYMQIDNIYQRN
jgi:hypothetical protein